MNLNKSKTFIKFCSESDTIKVENLLTTNNKENNYEISIKNLHDPLLKIVGMNSDYENCEELKSDIKRNNLAENEKLKILQVRPGKTKETQTALAQINRETYKNNCK